jgi:hypothetical protein
MLGGVVDGYGAQLLLLVLCCRRLACFVALQEPSQDPERVFRELFCAAVAVIHGIWVSQPRREEEIMCVASVGRGAARR